MAYRTVGRRTAKMPRAPQLQRHSGAVEQRRLAIGFAAVPQRFVRCIRPRPVAATDCERLLHVKRSAGGVRFGDAEPGRSRGDGGRGQPLRPDRRAVSAHCGVVYGRDARVSWMRARAIAAAGCHVPVNRNGRASERARTLLAVTVEVFDGCRGCRWYRPHQFVIQSQWVRRTLRHRSPQREWRFSQWASRPGARAACGHGPRSSVAARRRAQRDDMSSPVVRGEDVRALARSGRLTGPTCGVAPDYLQANLVIVTADLSPDFLRFCQQNPKPCPVLEVTQPGEWAPRHVAQGADLRTDLPRYRVFRRGVLIEEPEDIVRWWRDDLVAFLLGCSLSFEAAMQRAGLPVRHLEEGCNVPMYRTNLACAPSGAFRGPL